ncbi:MAG: WD40 repeat domain-containing protein [Chloroflexota bacterium]
MTVHNKQTKPFKSLIGILTFGVSGYFLLTILLLYWAYRAFEQPGFREGYLSDTSIGAIFIPLHCLAIPFYIGLSAFYTFHAAGNESLTKDQRISWFLRFSLIPFIALPHYYVRFVWPDPLEKQRSSNLYIKPLYQYRWIWLLLLGVFVIIVGTFVRTEILTQRYGQSSGEILYDIHLDGLDDTTPLTMIPSGESFAVGNTRGHIDIYDAQSGIHQTSLVAHHHPVKTLIYTADGQYLVSAPLSRTVTIWHTDSYEAAHVIPVGESYQHIIASPTGQHFLAALPAKRQAFDFDLWSFDYESAPQRLRREAMFNHAHFSADGQRLALIREDGYLDSYRLEVKKMPESQLLMSKALSNESDTRILDPWIQPAFTPDNQTLLLVISEQHRTAYRDVNYQNDIIKVVDIRAKQVRFERAIARAIQSNPVVLPDGESFMMLVEGGRIQQYRLSDGTIINTLYRPHLADRGRAKLALLPDGSMLISVWEDGLTIGWKIEE